MTNKHVYQVLHQVPKSYLKSKEKFFRKEKKKSIINKS